MNRPVSIQDIKNKLKLLVAYNIDGALELIRENLSQDNENINIVISLIARLQELNRVSMIGAISYDQKNIERGQIVIAILRFIDAATEADLNFKNILETLQNNPIYHSVLEKKIAYYTIKGLREDKKIGVESLNFKWDSYFLSNHKDSLLHKEQLFSAMELILNKYEQPISNWQEIAKSEDYHAVSDVIKNLQVFVGEDNKISPQELEELTSNQSQDKKPLLSAIHRTVASLL
ncbi:MAG: hypothetical protein AAF696_07200 [Bacteroidota bacterium]